MKNIISYLNERDLIYQITKKKELINKTYENNIKLYCGFDPTYESLHIGHIIPIICINKFIEYNHIPIIIIGGSTALIGDPSFNYKERKIKYTKEIIEKYTESINNQISNILNINKKKVLILNNSEWLNSINFIDFLQKIGEKIKINSILNKKSIKFRMQNNNKLSFKEFSYNILQSYDFLFLYRKHNIILQIGGSDQWGNITSGIKLIKSIYKKQTYGITFPILSKLNGEKFGKTKCLDSTIWLDKNKTSPYKFYQFWINIPDEFVYKYLKIFTNISINNINDICDNKNYKNYLLGKKIIANNLTKMIHGEDGLSEATEITKNLFSKKILDLKEKDLKNLCKNKFNSIELNKQINLQELLIILKIIKSKNESNNLIKQGSIKINGNTQNNIKYSFSNKDKLYKKYTVLSKGKKYFYIIKWNNI